MKVDESKIKIDWEHSDWQWFDPEKILDGSMDDDSVPKLGESLRRVYFGPHGMFSGGNPIVRRDNSAGRAFLETLEDLRTDTTNGARILATNAVKGMQRVAQCFEESSTDGSRSAQYWYSLKVAAYQFIHSARPSMSSAIAAAVLDAVNRVAQTLSDGRLDLETTYKTLEICICQRADTTNKVAAAFKRYIDSMSLSSDEGDELNIITLSSSSTIAAAITYLLGSTDTSVSVLKVTILESRPQCEGATLASSILSSLDLMNKKSKPQLTISIVPDTHISLVVRNLMTSTSKKPVLILLGADQITPLSHVSNKTGSTNLAILAKTFAPKQTQVIILSEEDKIAEPNSSLLSEYERLVHPSTDHNGNDTLVSTLSKNELNAQSPERHDAKEVFAAWPQQARDNLSWFLYDNMKRSKTGEEDAEGNRVSVHVNNVYFELVPREYIDVFISEKGRIGRDDILRRSIERAKLGVETFKDLY